jgi:hypothetical protein
MVKQKNYNNVIIKRAQRNIVHMYNLQELLQSDIKIGSTEFFCQMMVKYYLLNDLPLILKIQDVFYKSGM